MPSKDKAPSTKIRLNHSRYSHAYTPEESLWKDEIKRMLRLIAQHLRALENVEGKMVDKYSTDLAFLSIALFGTYGSGKSSLLRTFYQWINSPEHLRELENTDGDGGEPWSFPEFPIRTFKEKVYCLPLIEPNLQAKDDQFIYAFLAQALQADMDRNEPKYKTYRSAQTLSDIQEAFQEVSEYLKVLDSREKISEFDPLGISLERLERHTCGLRLQEKMHHFLDKLAESLCDDKKNSVILMPVDDADMSLDGLVSTLDSVRRYLQHPRLVPIFSFTGRLAEELLQVHFEKKLILDKSMDRDRLKEASTELSIAENLAIQYLGKLFPVRNRIKLGPAAARVQISRYFPHSSDKEGNDVFLLLQTASRVLFGYPEWSVLPSIRSPLRSSTLRRQLQIVDAMQESKVSAWVPPKDTNGLWLGPHDPDISWAKMYDRSTWSLLNVHRDVLKEYQLNLDDLYSWTPKGLRQVILASILDRPLPKRKQLIKNWVYRTEDRRSQMLSLLAANAFRPRMYLEEQTGDDPFSTKYAPRSGNQRQHDWYCRTFSIRKGSIWFFQLWIGFYLPQILAQNRVQRGKRALAGVGWDLRSGPIHAVREALINKQIHATGMLFLNPEEFSKKVKKFMEQEANPPEEIKGPRWQNILLQLWSCYGIHEGGLFSVVSFWRGMGLLAQILKVDVDYRQFRIKFLNDQSKTPKDINPIEKEEEQEEHLRKERERRLKATIYRHLKNARVLGAPTLERHNLNLQVEDIEGNPFEEFGQWRFDDFRTPVHHLTEAIIEWLDAFEPNEFRIEPMAAIDTTKDLHQTSREDWKACFVRRIHGENIMSLFWEDLENFDIGELKGGWDSYDALLKWCRVLAKYWDCGREFDPKAPDHLRAQNQTQTLILKCPFVEPFTISRKRIRRTVDLWKACWLALGKHVKDQNKQQNCNSALGQLLEHLKNKIETWGKNTLDQEKSLISEISKNNWSEEKTYLEIRKFERQAFKFNALHEDVESFFTAIKFQKKYDDLPMEEKGKKGLSFIETDPEKISTNGLLKRSHSFSKLDQLKDDEEIRFTISKISESQLFLKDLIKKINIWKKDPQTLTNQQLFDAYSNESLSNPRKEPSSMQASKLNTVHGKLESLYARLRSPEFFSKPEEQYPEMGWQPKFGFEDDDPPELLYPGCKSYLLAFLSELSKIERAFKENIEWVDDLKIPKSKTVIQKVPQSVTDPNLSD